MIYKYGMHAPRKQPLPQHVKMISAPTRAQLISKIKKVLIELETEEAEEQAKKAAEDLDVERAFGWDNDD